MKIKIMKTLLSVAVLTAITSTASAAPIGTAAGTEVDNTASITYSVGGTNQTPIESSEAGNSNPGVGNGTATTFVVDKKVDLLVTGATTTNVVPGQTGAADNTELTYTLTNEGNSTEDFTLTATDNLAIAVGTDDFNSTNCTVTAPALPVTIASGDVVNVTVECDIPASSATVKNGAKSLVDLLAEVTGVTASNGPDTVGCISGTPGTPSCVTDVVFADGTGTGTDVGGDRNAKHSATSTYVINTADLTVKKTQAATSMLINGTAETANVYHIPGSTIEYTITVSNAAGAATATGIVLSDVVSGDLENITATITGGTSGVVNVAGQTVTSAGFDLNAGETATLTITATVK